MRTTLVAVLFTLLASIAQADPRDDVKVLSLDAIEIKTVTDNNEYSIKVDVHNDGPRGKIYVDLVGKNTAGFQIYNVSVSGSFEANQTRSLTGRKLIYPQIGRVDRWEVDGYGKVNQ